MRTKTAPILAALLSLHCVGREDPVAESPPKTERAATPPAAGEPTAAPDPTAEPSTVDAPPSSPRGYVEHLRTLDPGDPRSLLDAVDAFVARNAAPDRDESLRFEELSSLLRFCDEVELRAERRLRSDPAFEAAVMHQLGEGEGHPEPSPEAKAEVEGLASVGLRVERIDGLLLGIDHAWIIARAGSALSPSARAYLEALAWDVRHTTRMEGDVPDDLAESIVRWEQLMDAGPPYLAQARRHAWIVAELYLDQCIVHDDDDEARPCRVAGALRASYERFVAEHTDSRVHAAVAQFLAGAKARRYELPIDDAVALRNESLGALTPERPRGPTKPSE